MRNGGENWDGFAYVAPVKIYIYEDVIDVGMMIGHVFEEKLSSKPFASEIKWLADRFDFNDGRWS